MHRKDTIQLQSTKGYGSHGAFIDQGHEYSSCRSPDWNIVMLILERSYCELHTA